MRHRANKDDFQMCPTYKLRWCFEYSDHKPKKYGMWSSPGEYETEQAWCQNKENLLWAKVEAKHFQTKMITTLAQCPGANFVNFNWIKASIGNLAPKGSMKLPGRVIGLMIITRNEKIQVIENGQIFRDTHNIDYSRINLRGFGR
jgi:hypothetical protein